MTRSPRDPGPPRGVLRGPGAPRIEHLRRAPSEALAEHVAHLWMVRWDLEAPFEAETLPHPTVHVTVDDRAALVGGIATGKFTRRLHGRGRVFGVKFRPGAFQPLYGAAMATLTDRRVPVAQLFGAAGARWARAVRAEPDVERCITMTETFLAPRLAPLPPDAVRVRDLVERLARDRDLLRVDDVATLAGIEPRRLQRLFRTFVGVSPKWVVQRYRLHEAAARLDGPRPPTIAALAQELGYFDQAHFVRDFRRVVGRPPSRR